MSSAMGPGMWRKVVATREFLTTLVARERLLLCVKGPVMTLQVLLAPKSVIALVALEWLGRVIAK